jgi:hypothetical protein
MDSNTIMQINISRNINHEPSISNNKNKNFQYPRKKPRTKAFNLQEKTINIMLVEVWVDNVVLIINDIHWLNDDLMSHKGNFSYVKVHSHWSMILRCRKHPQIVCLGCETTRIVGGNATTCPNKGCT